MGEPKALALLGVMLFILGMAAGVWLMSDALKKGLAAQRLRWRLLSAEKPTAEQKCVIYGRPIYRRSTPALVVYGEWDGCNDGSDYFSIADGEYGTGVEATHWIPLSDIAPPEATDAD